MLLDFIPKTKVHKKGNPDSKQNSQYELIYKVFPKDYSIHKNTESNRYQKRC